MAVITMTFSGCQTKSNNNDNDKKIDNARNECIDLNKKYNEYYNIAMLMCMKEPSEEWKFFAYCLQEIGLELRNVNKALGIDCIRYDEKGNPLMIEGKDGNKHPVEIIPEELKLSE